MFCSLKVLVLVAFFVHTGNGLECYNCVNQNCTYKIRCGPPSKENQRCYQIYISGTKTNLAGCATTKVCGGQINCCDTDLCNGAETTSTKQISTIIIATVLANMAPFW